MDLAEQHEHQVRLLSDLCANKQRSVSRQSLATLASGSAFLALDKYAEVHQPKKPKNDQENERPFNYAPPFLCGSDVALGSLGSVNSSLAFAKQATVNSCLLISRKDAETGQNEQIDAAIAHAANAATLRNDEKNTAERQQQVEDSTLRRARPMARQQQISSSESNVDNTASEDGDATTTFASDHHKSTTNSTNASLLASKKQVANRVVDARVFSNMLASVLSTDPLLLSALLSHHIVIGPSPHDKGTQSRRSLHKWKQKRIAQLKACAARLSSASVNPILAVTSFSLSTSSSVSDSSSRKGSILTKLSNGSISSCSGNNSSSGYSSGGGGGNNTAKGTMKPKRKPPVPKQNSNVEPMNVLTHEERAGNITLFLEQVFKEGNLHSLLIAIKLLLNIAATKTTTSHGTRELPVKTLLESFLSESATRVLNSRLLKHLARVDRKEEGVNNETQTNTSNMGKHVRNVPETVDAFAVALIILSHIRHAGWLLCACKPTTPRSMIDVLARCSAKPHPVTFLLLRSIMCDLEAMIGIDIVSDIEGTKLAASLAGLPEQTRHLDLLDNKNKNSSIGGGGVRFVGMAIKCAEYAIEILDVNLRFMKAANVSATSVGLGQAHAHDQSATSSSVAHSPFSPSSSTTAAAVGSSSAALFASVFGTQDACATAAADVFGSTDTHWTRRESRGHAGSTSSDKHLKNHHHSGGAISKALNNSQDFVTNVCATVIRLTSAQYNNENKSFGLPSREQQQSSNSTSRLFLHKLVVKMSESAVVTFGTGFEFFCPRPCDRVGMLWKLISSRTQAGTSAGSDHDEAKYNIASMPTARVTKTCETLAEVVCECMSEEPFLHELAETHKTENEPATSPDVISTEEEKANTQTSEGDSVGGGGDIAFALGVSSPVSATSPVQSANKSHASHQSSHTTRKRRRKHLGGGRHRQTRFGSGLNGSSVDTSSAKSNQNITALVLPAANELLSALVQSATLVAASSTTHSTSAANDNDVSAVDDGDDDSCSVCSFDGVEHVVEMLAATEGTADVDESGAGNGAGKGERKQAAVEKNVMEISGNSSEEEEEESEMDEDERLMLEQALAMSLDDQNEQEVGGDIAADDDEAAAEVAALVAASYTQGQELQSNSSQQQQQQQQVASSASNDNDTTGLVQDNINHQNLALARALAESLQSLVGGTNVVGGDITTSTNAENTKPATSAGVDINIAPAPVDADNHKPPLKSQGPLVKLSLPRYYHRLRLLRLMQTLLVHQHTATDAPTHGDFTCVSAENGDNKQTISEAAAVSPTMIHASSLVFDEPRCAETIEIFSGSRNKAVQKGDKKWGTAVSEVKLEGSTHRVYRWRVHLDKCEKGHAFIGVATREASSSNYLGSDGHGWGLIGTCNLWHNRTKVRTYGHEFLTGDTVTVILDTGAGTLSYASKGKEMGIAFKGLRQYCTGGSYLFPAVALYQKGDAVTMLPDDSDAGVSAAVLNDGRAGGGARIETPFLSGAAVSLAVGCARMTVQVKHPPSLLLVQYVRDLCLRVSNLLLTTTSNADTHCLNGVGAFRDPVVSTLVVPLIGTLALWPQRHMTVGASLALLPCLSQLAHKLHSVFAACAAVVKQSHTSVPMTTTSASTTGPEVGGRLLRRDDELNRPTVVGTEHVDGLWTVVPHRASRVTPSTLFSPELPYTLQLEQRGSAVFGRAKPMETNGNSARSPKNEVSVVSQTQSTALIHGMVSGDHIVIGESWTYRSSKKSSQRSSWPNASGSAKTKSLHNKAGSSVGSRTLSMRVMPGARICFGTTYDHATKTIRPVSAFRNRQRPIGSGAGVTNDEHNRVSERAVENASKEVTNFDSDETKLAEELECAYAGLAMEEALATLMGKIAAALVAARGEDVGTVVPRKSRLSIGKKRSTTKAYPGTTAVSHMTLPGPVEGTTTSLITPLVNASVSDDDGTQDDSAEDEVEEEEEEEEESDTDAAAVPDTTPATGPLTKIITKLGSDEGTNSYDLRKYETLARSMLLKSGFDESIIHEHLDECVSALKQDGNTYLSDGTSAGEFVRWMSAVTWPTKPHEQQQHDQEEQHNNQVKEQKSKHNILDDSDEAFLKSFASGDDNIVMAVFDRWMLRFAGRSGFLAIGGDTMRRARRKVVVALLLHTGLLQEARLLMAWISAIQQEAIALADANAKKEEDDISDPANPAVVHVSRDPVTDRACPDGSNLLTSASLSSSATAAAHKFPSIHTDPALRESALYDLLTNDMGAPTPSRMLTNVWKASQRVQEWVIRSKSQKVGSTFESLAEDLVVRAAFLLSVRPSPPPVLDFDVDTSIELPVGIMSPRNRYHAAVFERSISSINTNAFVESLCMPVDGGGSNDEDVRRRVQVLDSTTPTTNLHPSATGSRVPNINTGSSSKSRQFADAFSLSADTPVPRALTSRNTESVSIARKLEHWKRVSRQMTSVSIGGLSSRKNSVTAGTTAAAAAVAAASTVAVGNGSIGAGGSKGRSHSDAVDAVLSFLQSNVQVDQLKELMLRGSWRAMLRVVGLRLFRALVAGSPIVLPEYQLTTASGSSKASSRFLESTGSRFAFVFQSSKIAMLEWLPEAIRGKDSVAGSSIGLQTRLTESSSNNAGSNSPHIGISAFYGTLIAEQDGLTCRKKTGNRATTPQGGGSSKLFPGSTGRRTSATPTTTRHGPVQDAVLTVFDLPGFGLVDVDVFSVSPCGGGDDDEDDQIGDIRSGGDDGLAKLARSGGHYLGGLGGCGRTLARKVKGAFDELYSLVTAELEMSVVHSSNTDMQLGLLNSWGLQVEPEDHDLISRVSLFRVLHDVLEAARNASSTCEDQLAMQKTNWAKASSSLRLCNATSDDDINTDKEVSPSNSKLDATAAAWVGTVAAESSVHNNASAPDATSNITNTDVSSTQVKNDDASDEADNKRKDAQVEKKKINEDALNESLFTRAKLLIAHTRLKEQQRIVQAAIKVVHLLASQVVLVGDIPAIPNDTQNGSFASTSSRNCGSYQQVKWRGDSGRSFDRKPSGPAILGVTVFSMLFEELSATVEGIELPCSSPSSDQRTRNTEMDRNASAAAAAVNFKQDDDEDYCYQVLLLLDSVSVTAPMVSQKFLSGPEWLGLLIGIATHSGIQLRVQQRCLRLLNHLLPSLPVTGIKLRVVASLVSSPDSTSVALAGISAGVGSYHGHMRKGRIVATALVRVLFDQLLSVFPVASAVPLLARLLEKDGDNESNRASHQDDAVAGQARGMEAALSTSQKQLSTKASEIVALLRRLLCTEEWSDIVWTAALQEISTSRANTLAQSESNDALSSELNRGVRELDRLRRMWSMFSLLGGMHESIRVCGMVRLSPRILALSKLPNSVEFDTIARRAGVVEELVHDGHRGNIVHVLVKTEATVGDESGQNSTRSGAGGSESNDTRSLGLLSLECSKADVVPVSEVAFDAYSLMRMPKKFGMHAQAEQGGDALPEEKQIQQQNELQSAWDDCFNPVFHEAMHDLDSELVHLKGKSSTPGKREAIARESKDGDVEVTMAETLSKTDAGDKKSTSDMSGGEHDDVDMASGKETKKHAPKSKTASDADADATAADLAIADDLTAARALVRASVLKSLASMFVHEDSVVSFATFTATTQTDINKSEGINEQPEALGMLLSLAATPTPTAGLVDLSDVEHWWTALCARWGELQADAVMSSLASSEAVKSSRNVGSSPTSGESADAVSLRSRGSSSGSNSSSNLSHPGSPGEDYVEGLRGRLRASMNVSESARQTGAGGNVGGDSLGLAVGHDGTEEEVEIGMALQAMLGFGFPREACEIALARCGNDPQIATNFCLEHAEELQRMVNETRLLAANSVNHAAGAGAAGGTEDGTPRAGGAAQLQQERRKHIVVHQLMEMGFKERWCQKAHDVTNGVFDDALTWLLSNGDTLGAEDAAQEAAELETKKQAERLKAMETDFESHDPLEDDYAVSCFKGLNKGAVPVGIGGLRCTSGSEAAMIETDLSVSIRTTIGGFPTICAQRVLMNGGCWYHECTLHTDNCMQIGWVDAAFSGDAHQGDGVGDDAHSWAFDGYRRLKWHQTSEAWGRGWRTGDVVGVAIDFEKGELWFGLNGDWGGGMGCMFSGLCEGRDYVRGLIPAVSLNRQERLQLNFGESRFRFKPPEELGGFERCRPLHEGMFSAHNLRLGVLPPTLLTGQDDDVVDVDAGLSVNNARMAMVGYEQMTAGQQAVANRFQTVEDCMEEYLADTSGVDHIFPSSGSNTSAAGQRHGYWSTGGSSGNGGKIPLSLSFATSNNSGASGSRTSPSSRGSPPRTASMHHVKRVVLAFGERTKAAGHGVRGGAPAEYRGPWPDRYLPGCCLAPGSPAGSAEEAVSELTRAGRAQVLQCMVKTSVVLGVLYSRLAWLTLVLKWHVHREGTRQLMSQCATSGGTHSLLTLVKLLALDPGCKLPALQSVLGSETVSCAFLHHLAGNKASAVAQPFNLTSVLGPMLAYMLTSQDERAGQFAHEAGKLVMSELAGAAEREYSWMKWNACSPQDVLMAALQARAPNASCVNEIYPSKEKDRVRHPGGMEELLEEEALLDAAVATEELNRSIGVDVSGARVIKWSGGKHEHFFGSVMSDQSPWFTDHVLLLAPSARFALWLTDVLFAQVVPVLSSTARSTDADDMLSKSWLLDVVFGSWVGALRAPGVPLKCMAMRVLSSLLESLMTRVTVNSGDDRPRELLTRWVQVLPCERARNIAQVMLRRFGTSVPLHTPYVMTLSELVAQSERATALMSPQAKQVGVKGHETLEGVKFGNEKNSSKNALGYLDRLTKNAPVLFSGTVMQDPVPAAENHHFDCALIEDHTPLRLVQGVRVARILTSVGRENEAVLGTVVSVGNEKTTALVRWDKNKTLAVSNVAKAEVDGNRSEGMATGAACNAGVVEAVEMRAGDANENAHVVGTTDDLSTTAAHGESTFARLQRIADALETNGDVSDSGDDTIRAARVASSPSGNSPGGADSDSGDTEEHAVSGLILVDSSSPAVHDAINNNDLLAPKTPSPKGSKNSHDRASVTHKTFGNQLELGVLMWLECAYEVTYNGTTRTVNDFATDIPEIRIGESDEEGWKTVRAQQVVGVVEYPDFKTRVSVSGYAVVSTSPAVGTSDKAASTDRSNKQQSYRCRVVVSEEELLDGPMRTGWTARYGQEAWVPGSQFTLTSFTPVTAHTLTSNPEQQQQQHCHLAEKQNELLLGFEDFNDFSGVSEVTLEHVKVAQSPDDVNGSGSIATGSIGAGSISDSLDSSIRPRSSSSDGGNTLGGSVDDVEDNVEEESTSVIQCLVKHPFFGKAVLSLPETTTGNKLQKLIRSVHTALRVSNTKQQAEELGSEAMYLQFEEETRVGSELTHISAAGVSGGGVGRRAFVLVEGTDSLAELIKSQSKTQVPILPLRVADTVVGSAGGGALNATQTVGVAAVDSIPAVAGVDVDVSVAAATAPVFFNSMPELTFVLVPYPDTDDEVSSVDDEEEEEEEEDAEEDEDEEESACETELHEDGDGEEQYVGQPSQIVTSAVQVSAPDAPHTDVVQANDPVQQQQAEQTQTRQDTPRRAPAGLPLRWTTSRGVEKSNTVGNMKNNNDHKPNSSGSGGVAMVTDVGTHKSSHGCLVLRSHVSLSTARPFRLSASEHGQAMRVNAEGKSVRLLQRGGGGETKGLAQAQVGYSCGKHYWEVKVDQACQEFGTVFVGVTEKAPDENSKDQPPPPARALNIGRRVDVGSRLAAALLGYGPGGLDGLSLSSMGQLRLGVGRAAGSATPRALDRWDQSPSTFGFVNFRATYQTHGTQGVEVIYGEFFNTGDTIGVYLDMDAGKISFFLDGVQFGQHSVKDLGPAFTSAQVLGKLQQKRTMRSAPLVLYPTIGLRRSAGDQVSITGKHVSFAAIEPEELLGQLTEVARVLATWKARSAGTNLPDTFLKAAWKHYCRWALPPGTGGMTSRYASFACRGGGNFVEVDTSDAACVRAWMLCCKCNGSIGTEPLLAGDRVKIIQVGGNAIETPEESVVIGARQGKLWYKVDAQSGGGHEGTEESVGLAWYWNETDLGALEVVQKRPRGANSAGQESLQRSRTKEHASAAGSDSYSGDVSSADGNTTDHEEEIDENEFESAVAKDPLDFESFCGLVQQPEWAYDADRMLVTIVNTLLSSRGWDLNNIHLGTLSNAVWQVVAEKHAEDARSSVAEQANATTARANVPPTPVSDLPRGPLVGLTQQQIRGRLAVLRLFGVMLRRVLPLISLSDEVLCGSESNGSIGHANSAPASGESHINVSLGQRENGVCSMLHESLGCSIRQTRDILFTCVKRAYWDTVLKATTTPTALAQDEYDDPPQIRTVNVNRIKAAPQKLARIKSTTQRVRASVFGQLSNELSKWSNHSLRRSFVGKSHGGQKRAFKVRFLGEGVNDYGGPYRAVFEEVAQELQNDNEWPDSRRGCLLPLLLPCANRYNSQGDEGRDKFVVNPAKAMQGSSNLRKYEFVGKLTGMAVRHGMQMGLNLAQTTWKELADYLPLTRVDLEQIDKVFVTELETIEKVTKPISTSALSARSGAIDVTTSETLDESNLGQQQEEQQQGRIDNYNSENAKQESAEAMAEALGIERYFEVPLSDGSMVPLVSGNDTDTPEPLTFENRNLFVRLAEQIRLHEASSQLAMLRKGMGTVLPLRLFSLFTAEELEVLVCGNSQVDVGLLRQCTEYEGGVSETDQHVQYFWSVLEDMSNEDRGAFLRFVWARSRLPNSAKEMPTSFKLGLPSGRAREEPDLFLPTAQTCFFSLSLPKYTSKDIMREKLRYALKCTLMDADVRLRSAEGWTDE